MTDLATLKPGDQVRWVHGHRRGMTAEVLKIQRNAVEVKFLGKIRGGKEGRKLSVANSEIARFTESRTMQSGAHLERQNVAIIETLDRGHARVPVDTAEAVEVLTEAIALRDAAATPAPEPVADDVEQDPPVPQFTPLPPEEHPPAQVRFRPGELEAALASKNITREDLVAAVNAWGVNGVANLLNLPYHKLYDYVRALPVTTPAARTDSPPPEGLEERLRFDMPQLVLSRRVEVGDVRRPGKVKVHLDGPVPPLPDAADVRFSAASNGVTPDVVLVTPERQGEHDMLSPVEELLRDEELRLIEEAKASQQRASDARQAILDAEAQITHEAGHIVQVHAALEKVRRAREALNA